MVFFPLGCVLRGFPADWKLEDVEIRGCFPSGLVKRSKEKALDLRLEAIKEKAELIEVEMQPQIAC
jgi:hypothetical protein